LVFDRCRALGVQPRGMERFVEGAIVHDVLG
jgi:hypothetical protein